MRLEEGLLWAEPPVDICNETTAYGHFREIASASAPKPPSSREADDPLAFARRSPTRVSPNERAVRDAP
jgi:hypothetical protein